MIFNMIFYAFLEFEIKNYQFHRWEAQLLPPYHVYMKRVFPRGDHYPAQLPLLQLLGPWRHGDGSN